MKEERVGKRQFGVEVGWRGRERETEWERDGVSESQ